MTVLITNEGSIIKDGTSSVPKGTFTLKTNVDGQVNLKSSNGEIEWLLNTPLTLDGVSISTPAELVNALSAFSRGGGGGSGASVSWGDITDKPSFLAVGSTVPSANGTAAAGTSAQAARADHVHPLQSSVATLTTGRTFSLTGGATGTSAAFNGSANASIAVTLATPTSTVRGGVLQGAAIADSTATDVAGLVTDFNALLSELRRIGQFA